MRFVYPNTLQSCLHSNQAKGAADLTRSTQSTYLERLGLFLAENCNSPEITYGQCSHCNLEIVCVCVGMALRRGVVCNVRCPAIDEMGQL